MNDSPSERLHALIRDYLAGAIGFVGLWDGVFALLPALYGSGSATMVELADRALGLLVDVDEGDRAIGELGTALRELVEVGTPAKIVVSGERPAAPEARLDSMAPARFRGAPAGGPSLIGLPRLQVATANSARTALGPHLPRRAPLPAQRSAAGA